MSFDTHNFSYFGLLCTVVQLLHDAVSPDRFIEGYNNGAVVEHGRTLTGGLYEIATAIYRLNETIKHSLKNNQNED